MARSAFYLLGRIAGVQLRKAKWLWESAAGSDEEAIRAEHGVGRDMAAAVLRETPRDPDPSAQALLDEVAAKLTPRVRNQLHRFEMTALDAREPIAFALPGGFIFMAGSLVRLVEGRRDEVAFVLAHEMAHVIRRHAIDRLLQQKVVSALAMASPARGGVAGWIRQVGLQGLARAYSQEQEFEADELGLRLMRAAGFDPAGAIRLLEQLGALEETPGALGLGSYLSTHPPIADRAGRLRRLADERPPRA